MLLGIAKLRILLSENFLHKKLTYMELFSHKKFYSDAFKQKNFTQMLNRNLVTARDLWARWAVSTPLRDPRSTHPIMYN